MTLPNSELVSATYRLPSQPPQDDTVTDYRALCAELADSIELLLELRPANAKPLRITEERLQRARTALAQPEPAGEVTDDELPPRVGHILRLAEIIREVDGNHDKGAAALAEAILSHPDICLAGLAAPVQPAEGEVGDEDWWCEVIGKAWDKYETVDHQGERFMHDSDFGLAVDFIRAELSRRAPVQPAEALAARPLLERVAAMGNCIGQHTVGEIMAISDRAAAWLAANPPGKPIAIEPRGCPIPGACSCVQPEPVPVSEHPDERQGWCDSDGRCWWGRHADSTSNADWFYATWAETIVFCEHSMPQVSLPHNALPLPKGQSIQGENNV